VCGIRFALHCEPGVASCGSFREDEFDDQSLHPPRQRACVAVSSERLYRLSWSDPAALRSPPPRKGAGNGLRHQPSFEPSRNIFLTKPKNFVFKYTVSI